MPRRATRYTITGTIPPMPELCPPAPTPRESAAKVQIAEVASRQWGVVTWTQLKELGLTRTGISRWQAESRLHRIYPRVYAVGHGGLAMEGKLAAALFYAGPGAALGHVTAGWWSGMLQAIPTRMHVCTPGKRVSLGDVCVHGRKQVERIWHKRLPITPHAQTLLDIAGQIRFQELRRALAEAEYMRLVTLEEVAAVLGRGRPGSATLRAALDCHRPQLAKTKSRLEEKFLLLCERHRLTPPGVNVWIAGWLVDAVWYEQKVVVELDGRAAHSTSRAIERDHRRDLELRAAGYTVLRYTWQQITETPELVVADLRRELRL
jgi:very-short-patch-repair endonuclease